QYARANGFTKIIVGKAKRPRWREILYGTLADHIIRKSGDIDVYVVPSESEAQKTSHRASFWKTNVPLQYYLSALLISVVISALLLPLRPYVQSVNLVMPYLIGIVASAVRFGRAPALAATLFSGLIFNFAFVRPYYELKVSDEEQITSFLVLLVTGMIIGSQTARLRLQAIYSRRREENTAALYDMTRELSANRGKQTLADIIASHIADVMESEVTMWMANTRGELSKLASQGGGAEARDAVREESAAHWAFSHKQVAGLGTETLPSAAGFYVPLISSGNAIGVIGVIPKQLGKTLPSDRVALLETFANLTASALDRAVTGELIERTMLETEGEKLRNILLSSVSHDLRTPLASITGAASTLLLEGHKITEEYRDELLRLIHEEAARLARMVTNLLDVSSLESGSVKLNRELYFIEELIGSALMRTEQKLGGRKVITHIEQGLPLVRMDGLLIEQVLINLLENVAEHTPEGTEVSITVKMIKPDIHIIIQDNGPGINAGDEERIFDKFYSVDRRATGGGMSKGGMGLAICRGIIHAHEGRIWARNAPGGGTTITFTLPVKTEE
ncbi:MAG: DUF4118 domain-containing protein, partial [Alphaproteobacteria bacterium]|nr:DUF4118 domain-containing protein [Alphaproteobacteria bacterium]